MSGLALASHSGRRTLAVLSFVLRCPGQIAFVSGLFALTYWSLNI